MPFLSYREHTNIVILKSKLIENTDFYKHDTRSLNLVTFEYYFFNKQVHLL